MNAFLKEGIVTRKEFEGWHFAAISYIKLESCEMHTRFTGIVEMTRDFATATGIFL